MKSFLLTSFSIVAILTLGVVNAGAHINDDFSDGDDTANPTWTHLSRFANSTGQTWDASTGQYRLQAPNNGVIVSGVQYGFVGSYTGPLHSDSEVKADFVQNETGLAYGIATRLNGLDGVFNSPGRTQGYVYAYEPLARGGLGEMVMYRFGISPFDPFQDMGDPAGVEGVDWIRKVTLDFANKDYTFSLTAVGNTITGVVREIGGGIVAYQSHVDSTYTSGYAGVISVGATQGPLVLASDITIDNFMIRFIPEPTAGVLFACGAVAMFFGRRYRRTY